MIKKHQRTIAAFAAFFFLSLLQAAAMPARTDHEPGRKGASMESPAPGFLEEEGNGPSVTSSKSLVPVILIGIGALAAAVLLLVVMKNKYDIVGTWILSASWTKPVSTVSFEITFNGDKLAGTVKTSTALSGSYSVSGKDAEWNIGIAYYIGQFDSKTSMTGTMTNAAHNSGTFKATKKASTASLPGGFRR